MSNIKGTGVILITTASFSIGEMMDFLIILFWSLFIFATHELAHIIIAKHYGHYAEIKVYWYGVCVNLKFPIDVHTWFKIISAGIIATTPLVVFLSVYYNDNFFALLALLISTIDILLLFSVYRIRKTNPFFNYITEKMRLSFTLRIAEES